MKAFKTITYLFTLLSMLSLIIACDKDNPDDSTDPAQFLTNGSEKTWRIADAILTNSSGSFEISNNFNVVDDEFIFKKNGTFIWRSGNAINIEGTNSNETLLDYYVSPITSTYVYNEDSSTELTALNGTFTFTIEDNETITGILTFEESKTSTQIEVILKYKKADDYPAIPVNGLHFNKVFTFESDGINSHAPSMIGSYSNNSLFFATREDGLSNGWSLPERILKFDINTGSVQENLYYYNGDNDYVSKQLHIINNQLIVIGGKFVNTYDLDLSGDPTSTAHGLVITRFGMAVTGDNAYIIGGDMVEYNDPADAEKIYKWNINDETLTYITDMPEDRFGARGTIVNDKLYVFGGNFKWYEYNIGDANNTIYIYDIKTGNLTTEYMTTAVRYSCVDKFQNLIYVAGHYLVSETDWEFIIAVYNTETNTYQEIPTNLSQEGRNVIHAMCIFNNKMFVLYGEDGEDNGGQFPEWSIYAADIN